MADKRNGNPEAGLVVVEQVLPIKLPIVPLYSRPVFPGMLTPIMINEKQLIDVVDYAMERDGYIGLLLAKDGEEDGKPDNLFRIGTVAKVLKKINLPDGSVNIFVNTIKRFEVRKFISLRPVLTAAAMYEAPSRKNLQKDDEIKAAHGQNKKA